MILPTTTDSDLLAAWAHHRDESAFHALVVRYAGLVQMAAQRTCGDMSLAADASQLVFTQLAQSSKSLLGHPSLAGWLHVTASMKAKSLVDKTLREDRKRRLFQSAMDPQTSTPQESSWLEIQPDLTDAVNTLSAKDREAILLRFYRSLSVKEIAATLGIGTDAAQKRLDRATERLRGKLTRRGVTTAGSLSAVMLAGYASEAKAAALSTSVLSSKAIAASAIPPTSLFATLFAMKATSYIAPVAVLLCGGLFLNSQSQAIARVEKEISQTRAVIAAQKLMSVTTRPVVKPPSFIEQMKDKPLDWEQIARELEKNPLDSRENRRIVRDLEPRIRNMSREDLIAACDAIAKLDCSAKTRADLEDLVVEKLASVDPAYAIGRFWEADRQPGKGARAELFGRAFGQWVKGDFEKAAAWMDAQVAAGKFDSPSVSGYDGTFAEYEGAVLESLFIKDSAAAASRLRAIPPEGRSKVMYEVDFKGRTVDVWVNYANLTRSLVPPADQARLIGKIAWSMDFNQQNLPQLADYLKQISASPEERAETMDYLTQSYSTTSREDRTPTREDYDAVRAWVGQQAPQDLDSFTGHKLMRDTVGDILSFDQAVELLNHYHDEGGGDELILGFLPLHDSKYRPKLLELAAKIQNPKTRARVLEDYR